VIELVTFMDSPSKVEGRRCRSRQGFRCMSPGPALLDLWLEADLPLATLPTRQESLSSYLAGDSKGALNSFSFHSVVFSSLRC